jgi:hypothetical protein
MSEWAQLKGQARASRSLFGKKKQTTEAQGEFGEAGEDGFGSSKDGFGSSKSPTDPGRKKLNKNNLNNLNNGKDGENAKTLDAAQKALTAAQNVLNTTGQAEYAVPPGTNTV